ncbi:unnamed protein product [Nyctereutes procyonoides]|uniref:Large ribosomal subunit protein uL6 n=1 Tax=Nyctereutes procyonoides TaxID=34880 RepID=A0A811ZBJ7_NYCPR|nr:unnamed protein product [Nyctereutes procyonoides]
MKVILSRLSVNIPENINITLKGCTVIVKGPRASIYKWRGNRKELATVHTTHSHAHNMIKGITLRLYHKMRSVYAHFPIHVVIQNGCPVETENFLGEKYIFRVWMRPGVACSITQPQKDELILEESDSELVSNFSALIQQATTVKNRDIRNFLNGF